MKRRILVALLAIAPMAAALSGCASPLGEFTPLYATAAGPGLSRIETRSPDGRTGYLLRESVDDAFGLDRTQPPLYRLILRVKESRRPLGLRVDNVANRYEMSVRADYVLVDLATRMVMDRGSETTVVSYDSADQAYAAVAAHQNGQLRAATDLAQRLRISLATYFADPQTKAERDKVVTAMREREAAAGANLGRSLTEGPNDAQSIPSPSQRAGETEPGQTDGARDVIRLDPQ